MSLRAETDHTLDGEGRRVSAGIHQAAQQDGHILDVTLLESWRILKKKC